MILPVGAANFTEAMRMGAEVYQHLKLVIKEQYGIDATNVGKSLIITHARDWTKFRGCGLCWSSSYFLGDEGGFAPNIQDPVEGLELLTKAIEKSGYTGKIKIALDAAASEFFTEDRRYDFDFKNKNKDGSKIISGKDLAALYKTYSEKYPIVSIEDPFDQDDFESYNHLTSDIGANVQIVGDDLLVTNPKRIHMAIEKKACNALLLKVNQIGSVTEAIDACLLSQKQGWGVMVSHRSGETEDTFIADLVVGLGTGQIKTGKWQFFYEDLLSVIDTSD